ncbi:MAG: dienelactone hydrolase family protein [Chloroflexota bacterium]
MAAYKTGWVTYQQDGYDLRAYTAAPEVGGPGVLVLHAWWGLTPFFERLCQRLAERGFTALAPDLFGGQTADTVDAARQLVETHDSRLTGAAAFGGMKQLARLEGVNPACLGTLGFSFGAAWALVLAEELPQVQATVLFYGSYEADFSRAQAAFQGHFAEKDEWEPLEGINAMQAAMQQAGRETAFHFYPATGHWFFEDNRPDAYNPAAAELAWERTLQFLAQKLGGA